MALWTQADVDRLKEMMSSGAKSVRYEGPPGRSFEAHSLTEMRALLAEMVASVARSSGQSKGYTLAATRKGV